jgi:hypothetical protein
MFLEIWVGCPCGRGENIMIWTASNDALTVIYNKKGIIYHCEIVKDKAGYSLTIFHKILGDATECDFIITGNKTKELVESAEKFLEAS